ncbi:DNA (cytosine-5-)-methyltransferase [Streptomyces sp. MB09-02B]|uniref:DNA cytosine methyltransferase n=1 Tax=Streptomyces sp. MB09-02B TaxID=3028667 RepID=UPI0029B136E2|nr:DNA (cytosine-5-)-methyltransferase [Streptomyces sp. MB09-02B]MDX3639291.1 DNA (cytosine-5-)-methyltransferase [Streptomyces sp. MB09-02B]
MTRIGSLCTGYGGLDMAVQQVFGGTVAWHSQYEPPDKNGREDKNQYAAQILAHHWPTIPNHGDLTAIDFAQVEPVDILTAGFPCQDVSLAGLRAGLAEGTRSGLWLHVARAIEELQPRLVVIENVRGLLSAPADSDLEPCTWCVGDAGGEPSLRALGAVLADLARLGFDAEWGVFRASDVGAPHQRERVFLLAWPADAQGAGLAGAGLLGPVAECDRAAADADGVGGERDRARSGRRHEPAAHDLAAAHAAGVGEREPADETHPVAGSRDAREVPGSGSGASVQWGEYEPAIRRWEHILGRPAPQPTDALGRLAPAFVEWMQGLPTGHVTSVPGLPRGAQLKALGNGVVPQQAAAALRLLVARRERLAVAS